jgi:uncharacterized protein YigA (DUF484 family)
MNKTSTAGPGVDAADVARYLRTHPDFFNEHAELLREIAIPHAGRSVVSLWERQIAALREEHEKLRIRFENVLVSARENAELIGRVHRLALALIAAAGPQAILRLLEEGLTRDLRAERVTVLVFGTPAYVDGAEAGAFVGRESARRDPFAALLADAKAACGTLTPAQVAALFPAGDFAGSHVVLPMAGRGWDGLLAISSADPARFGVDLGTEFLSFLRDVAVLVLSPWVARPQ